MSTKTIEQKARAYDEALKQAKFYHGNCPSEPERKKLEKMFPVLHESEDEEMLQTIIRGFENWKSNGNLTFNNTKVDDIIAYLEKQKENPKSANSIASNCTSDAKYENRWHKVEDSLPDNGRLVLANDCLGNTLLARYYGEGNWEVSVYDNEDYYCRNTITKWCEIPSEKQKEQKPEWSEEDERIRRTLVEYFGPKVQLDFVKGIPIQKIRDWLEKQKEQKPAEWSDYKDKVNIPYCSSEPEWSEEDEDKVARYLHDKDGGMLWSKATEITSDILDILRPQPSWKPSEEQMKALQNAVALTACDKELARLYNQLQKL